MKMNNFVSFTLLNLVLSFTIVVILVEFQFVHGISKLEKMCSEKSVHRDEKNVKEPEENKINNANTQRHLRGTETNIEFNLTDLGQNEDRLPDKSKSLERSNKRDLSKEKSCWITLDAFNHFEKMEKLEGRYKNAIQEFQRSLGEKDLDKELLQVFLQTRGTAIREVYRTSDPRTIPAGLNLGSHGLIKLPTMLLLFHRMKLRNSTNFRVDYLHYDVKNMAIMVRVHMDTLHLMGDFFRSSTTKNLSVLIYTPNHGTMEILLDGVEYKMEGRLRVLKDRLNIEMVVSDIDFKKITLTYQNSDNSKATVYVQKRQIYDFVDRLKMHLDHWMKDYFNDFLMYYKLKNPVPPQFLEFDKKKSLALNQYLDGAITNLKSRIFEVGAEEIALSKFKILCSDGLEFEIHHGVLRGLESMYRRSIATTNKSDLLRSVGALVGFSDLKVEYQYTVLLPGSGVRTGSLLLSSDELTVHLRLNLVKSPETVEIQIDSAQQMKPEALTVEGAAGTFLTNFKFLLEQHIQAILTSNVHNAVKQLETLAKCEPKFIRYRPNKEAN